MSVFSDRPRFSLPFPAQLALAAVLLAGCRSPQLALTPPPPASTQELSDYLTTPRPGCFEMVHRFCDALYAPSVAGNLDLALGDRGISIRRGKTHNHLSQAYLAFAEAQHRHRKNLPADFQASLAEGKYFDKLTAYLRRKPPNRARPQEVLGTIRLQTELDAAWKTAVEQTVTLRMEAQYPDFLALKPDQIPVELNYEKRRKRAQLISQISQAFWRDHPNWKRVMAQMEEVRTTFLGMTAEAPLPEKIKRDWQRRLKTVRLVIPGADPQVDNFSCSRTEQNAYYYPYRNQMTVCAGNFNADDNIFTLAHEMAHSLGHLRSILLFERQSALGEKLANLREKSCEPKNYSCEDWKSFKESFDELVVFAENFEPQLPHFRACLLGKPGPPEPDLDSLRRRAERESRRQVTRSARKGLFLRLVTEQIPLSNGALHPNPMFLNPCGYYLWERKFHPFEEELALMLFFNAEYQCNAEENRSHRFAQAVETAASYHTKLILARMRMEGWDSRRQTLAAEEVASTAEERFADALASEVFARYLSREPDVFARRAVFLSNISGYCPQPSLGKLHPEMARMQSEIAALPHSLPNQRLREILTSSVRETLQCELDFSVRHCPIRPPAPVSAMPAIETPRSSP